MGTADIFSDNLRGDPFGGNLGDLWRDLAGWKPEPQHRTTRKSTRRPTTHKSSFHASPALPSSRHLPHTGSRGPLFPSQHDTLPSHQSGCLGPTGSFTSSTHEGPVVGHKTPATKSGALPEEVMRLLQQGMAQPPMFDMTTLEGLRAKADTLQLSFIIDKLIDQAIEVIGNLPGAPRPGTKEYYKYIEDNIDSIVEKTFEIYTQTLDALRAKRDDADADVLEQNKEFFKKGIKTLLLNAKNVNTAFTEELTTSWLSSAASTIGKTAATVAVVSTLLYMTGGTAYLPAIATSISGYIPASVAGTASAAAGWLGSTAGWLGSFAPTSVATAAATHGPTLAGWGSAALNYCGAVLSSIPAGMAKNAFVVSLGVKEGKKILQGGVEHLARRSSPKTKEAVESTMGELRFSPDHVQSLRLYLKLSYKMKGLAKTDAELDLLVEKSLVNFFKEVKTLQARFPLPEQQQQLLQNARAILSAPANETQFLAGPKPTFVGKCLGFVKENAIPLAILGYGAYCYHTAIPVPSCSFSLFILKAWRMCVTRTWR